MRLLLWFAIGIGAIISFFAWANWNTRRRRLRTTKQQFVQALEEFLSEKLEVDAWELFLGHPMGDPELEALRLRLQGFTWEAGEGRAEMREALTQLRNAPGLTVDRTNLIRSLIESFLGRRSDIRQFWHAFAQVWPPTSDDVSVTAYDGDFFDELADRLHGADFVEPPDEHLRSPEEIRSWLASNYPAYLVRAWSNDDSNAAS